MEGEDVVLRKFYPNEYRESVYQIDFEKYYKKGYRGIMFDIDNTLVPHNAPADDRAVLLLKKLRKIGFRVCLLSNNKEKRVADFSRAVGSEFYIHMANKPSRSGYRRAMAKMGTDQINTLFVGDQLFTDIYGANRAGVRSILVKPMNPKEEIQIVLKRQLENVVLHFYRSHQHR